MVNLFVFAGVAADKSSQAIVLNHGTHESSDLINYCTHTFFMKINPINNGQWYPQTNCLDLLWETEIWRLKDTEILKYFETKALRYYNTSTLDIKILRHQNGKILDTHIKFYDTIYVRYIEI